MKNSVEGLFKVLMWRIEEAITEQEFTQLYKEWAKRRNISEMPLSAKS
jgi:hypothetical protein